MDHCIKLFNLESSDIVILKKVLSFFIKRGIKITFLKKVVFIHLNDDQTYSAIFNILYHYYYIGKMSVTKKNEEWLKQYMKI